MATAWRPTLRQLISLISDIYEMPVSELATPAVLRRARTACAAPNAEYFGGELYGTIPLKAVALTGALLANPPLIPEAPRVACQSLRGFLRRNDCRWDAPVLATILRFQAEMRRGEVGLELGEWISQRIVTDPGGERSQKPQNWMRLFTVDDPDGSHVVYQAGPVAGLPSGDHGLQLALATCLEEAVAATSEADAVALTLDNPGVELSPLRAPGRRDYEIWHRNRLSILSQADALIVTDVGTQRTGFGSAMEVDLMAAQGGPILYLRSREGDGCSRYLSGRGDELDLSICDYDTPEEARALAVEWLADRSNAIIEMGRRRADRVYAAELLLRRLRASYLSLEPARKAFVSGSLGMTPILIDAALEHPAATELIFGDRLSAFFDLVGIEEADSGDGLAGIKPDKPRADTLLEAARELDWDARTIQWLWSDALEQWESADRVSRLSYHSRTDWIRRKRASE